MKKVIPILLCVLLIGALAFSVSAEGSSVSLTTSATTLERGDTFTIVANLTNTDAINLCTVALTFDTNAFELVGGSYLENAAYGDVKMEGQVAAGSFMFGQATKVSGQIFTFTFKVKNDAALDTYTFTPTASIGPNAQIPATGTTIAVTCQHNYSNWADAENGKHQKVCSKCGDKKEEDHDWNDGEGKPSCDQISTIKYTCLICQTTKTENINPIGHKYDNDCDATCNNNCGTTRPVSHNYSSTFTNDANGHWYECTSCGEAKGSWAKHTPGAEATTTTAQVCTVCNYEIKPALGHTHVLEKDWTTDSDYHWHRCETRNPPCYHVADKEKHKYDNDCDVDCNTCGYIRVAPHNYKPEWQANGEGHWQICATCNAKSEIFEHVPGPEATMDTPQTCTECNFVIKRELSHQHDFGDTWYSDDQCHWQSCGECHESTEMVPHVWGEGVELADGKMQYTCSVCQKQVETDGEQPGTSPTIQVPTTQKPTEPSGADRFPWQWAGIAAIILLVIGVTLLVIEFIRSRKSNMHGKFSK